METKTMYANLHGIQGAAQSYWIATTPDTHYPSLQDGINVDVAIIGGGFVGIISAIFLRDAGFTVAVIEGKRILEGVTGNTTAKITSLHRLIYHDIIARHGMEKAKQYAASNELAIDTIESLVTTRSIECDFSHLRFYTYATTDKTLGQIEAEVKAAEKLGLPVSFKSEIPLPIPTRGAICFENQAQFHPRKFLLALASSIPGNGSYIFENSRVNDIEHGETCTIISDKKKLKARNVIIATNFPIFDKEGLYFARLKPSRSYAIACDIHQPFPRGMFIDADESGYAWRAQPENGRDIAVISGRSHTAGHGGDLRENYKELENTARQVYGNTGIEYSWSTQDNIPFDKVPFIGKLSPLHNNEYVAAGFSKWGMTNSIVAGTIISDLIRGRKNPWADVYDPLRFTPDAASAKRFFSDNTHVVKTFIEGHLSKLPDISQLAQGEGKIVKENGRRIAAYKDEHNNVYRLSPFCTHMGCVVNWNNAERTWDCPCHGSRYSYTGEVVQSPTVKKLENLGESKKKMTIERET